MARSLRFVLASDSRRDLDRMRRIAHAVEAQISGHVHPVWKVSGVVRAYRTLDAGLRELPGACPVLVSKEFTFAAHGVHLDYADDQPFALIRDDGDPQGVSTGISHEIIEILVDPTGLRTVAGPSIMAGQGPVEYLVEVCDPPEDVSYRIGDVAVSDFCTPRYYDASAPPGSRFDHKGEIDAPLGVLDQGYLSWRDTKTGKWWQRRRFKDDDRFVDLGHMDATGGSMRAHVDHAVRAAEQPPAGPARARTPRDKVARMRWMADRIRPEEPYPPPRP